MKRWRTPDGGTLAEGADGCFHLLDCAGAVARDYAPRIDSVQESLYTTIYVVSGGALIERMAVDTDAVSRTEERRELEGLAPLDPDESPTPADVRAALAARAEEEDQAAAKRRSRTEALARAPSDALPELEAPRYALAKRVVQYSDDIAKALLLVLSDLAELHDELDGRADAQSRVESAADELASAARLITYCADSDDGETPLFPYDFGPTPSAPQGPLLEALVAPLAELAGTPEADLLERLEELQREVVFHADVQYQFDALNTMRTFLRAATRIARAAPHVAAASLQLRGG